MANAKYVHVPGSAIQKNCLMPGTISIVVMIANQTKNQNQYLVLDFCASMKNFLQK
jgi:hypothetical protein